MDLTAALRVFSLVFESTAENICEALLALILRFNFRVDQKSLPEQIGAPLPAPSPPSLQAVRQTAPSASVGRNLSFQCLQMIL